MTETTVFSARKILTMNPSRPEATHVAVRDGRILGLQAVGRHVAELAGEFAHALAMGAVLDDLAHTIHVHPTLGEAIGEAALIGLGQPLHV